nr:hypothetical protein [Tanacetum cinerariifolium]
MLVIEIFSERKKKKNDDVEEKKDDKNDDNDDLDNHTLVRGEVSGSLETRNEQTHILIPSPPRSPRTDLPSNKTLSEELIANVLTTPNTTSKDLGMSQPTSSTSKILPGSVAKLSIRHGQLREQLTNTFITKEYFEGKMKEMSDTLNNLVPELTVEKTKELMKEAIPRMVNDVVKKDREIFTYVVPELVSKEFATHAPKIIEELFKLHMKHKVLNVHPTVRISTTKTTADLKQTLYLKIKTDLQAQETDPEMWDILKNKFEKSSASSSSGKVHDARQDKMRKWEFFCDCKTNSTDDMASIIINP